MDDKFYQDLKSKYGYPRPRNYIEFIFNKPEHLEINQLEKLQFSLRQLNKKNDTINGIKVHFGKKTDYGVFVRVIDILGIENMPTWQPIQDDIYISVGPKKINQNKFTCPGTLYDDSYLKHLQEINEEKEFKLKVLLFKQNWILFLGYFGIFLLNIFALVHSIVKANRNFTQPLQNETL